jgi:hypothetical protein
MVQRKKTNDAVVKDALIKFEREECALSMEQSVNDATLKDAQINPKEEDCVTDTEQH